MNLHFHIIRDYRNFFYSSTVPPDSSVKLDKLSAHLKNLGAEVSVWDYRKIDLSANWQDALVVYQSCEDLGLFYKDYNEDIILALQKRGAVLIPEFWAFRCHHNKAFQELTRDLYLPESTVRSHVFGCLEDFEKEISTIEYPCVLKMSAGAKSTGVSLCRTEKELRKRVRKISASINWTEWLKDRVKRLVRSDYVPVSQHKRKFLIQTFIPGLSEDYKVLVYGSKAFAMKRNVRPNDFRASGSGNFIVNEKIPQVILEYAFDLVKKFDVPYCSLDIALYNGSPELLEFQFVSFGTITLTASNRHFEKTSSGIHEVSEGIELEKVLADALVQYAGTKYGSHPPAPAKIN